MKPFKKYYSYFNQDSHSLEENIRLNDLQTSLVALNTCNGNEVIVTSNKYISATLLLTFACAKPILVESYESIYKINTTKIITTFTSNLEAIIPVHLHGKIIELEENILILKKYNSLFIENIAKVHRTSFYKKLISSLEYINAKSTYSQKKSGAYLDPFGIITNESFAQRRTILTNYGSQQKKRNKKICYKIRLGKFQTLLSSIKLKYNNNWAQEGERYGCWYYEKLSSLEKFILSLTNKKPTSFNHLYVIQTSKINDLQSCHINTDIVILLYYAIRCHFQKCYSKLIYSNGNLPISEKTANYILN